MENNELDSWMHASDDERNSLQHAWNVEKGDGEGIAKKVSKLFKDECVYSILEVDISNKQENWEIEAFVGMDDFESLKNRYNIQFLGFSVNFNDIASYR